MPLQSLILLSDWTNIKRCFCLFTFTEIIIITLYQKHNWNIFVDFTSQNIDFMKKSSSWTFIVVVLKKGLWDALDTTKHWKLHIFVQVTNFLSTKLTKSQSENWNVCSGYSGKIYGVNIFDSVFLSAQIQSPTISV